MIDERKRGIITKEDSLARVYQVLAEIDVDEWRIIEDLRTRAPDDERELAREVADWMEKERCARDRGLPRTRNPESEQNHPEQQPIRNDDSE